MIESGELPPGSAMPSERELMARYQVGRPAVREAMHAAFLFHAIQAGLDMAIVNAGQLAVYEEIEPELRTRVEDVLLNRRDDATERLVDFAESVKVYREAISGNFQKKLAHREPMVFPQFKLQTIQT